MRQTYSPEHDEEPPEYGLVETEVVVAACHDCQEVLGPTHGVDVGHELHLCHEGHDTEIVAQWTATEVLEDVFFGGDR